MPRTIGVLIAILCGSFAVVAQQRSPPPFHAQRETTSDLEVTGLVKGVPPGESRFVSRVWIAGLPRVSVRLKHSDDFPGISAAGVMLSGVPLDLLARRLGAVDEASVVEAICADSYTATYDRAYVRRHHPLFVLAIDGLSLREWAIKNHQYDAQPYFIGYKGFVPAFRVLSHKDQPLEPTGVLKLRFGTEEQVFTAIKPKKLDGSANMQSVNLQIVQGYRIARQSCFRCHNAGDHGGGKAKKDWNALGGIAKNKPEWFGAWVRDPQAIDPKAEMPPNKLYDKATLTALQRYFATFAVEGQ